MKTIKFLCHHCEGKISAEEDFWGDVAECPHCGQGLRVPMPGIEEALQLGGFIIERKLGAGGMGEVWLARQLSLERMVALKILSPALTEDERFVKRFLQEVKTSGKLNHPNIVAAFDAGIDKGIYYLAIAYIDGEELEHYIERCGVIPEKPALQIIHAVAEALRYAWERFSLLHRDIKPANIMIDVDGMVRVMDMGISKSKASEADQASLTVDNHFIGTPYYMSPEQAQADRNIDFRTDVYALGATLFHMVTGSVPYQADSVMGILSKHITAPLPAPEGRNPALSRCCAALIESMMAKDPAERPASWDDVLKDIERVMQDKMPATPLPAGHRLAKWQDPDTAQNRLRRNTAKRFPGIITAITAGLAVLLITGLWLSLDREGETAMDPAMPLAAITNYDHHAEESDSSIEAAWLDAAAFTSNTISTTYTYDKALQRLKIIEQEYPHTRYARLAAEMSVTVSEALLQHRSRVQNKLRSQASDVAQQAGGAEASEYLLSYNGPLSDKLLNWREQEAAVFTAQAEARKAADHARIQAEISALSNTVNKVFQDILMGNWQQAQDRWAPYTDEETYPFITRLIHNGLSIDQWIYESFIEDRGSTVDLNINSRTGRYVILSVTPPVIEGRMHVDRGYITISFTLQQLTPDEKLRRLQRTAPALAAVQQAAAAVQAGQRELAEDFIARTGSIAPYLLDAANEVLEQHQTARIEEPLIQLAKEVGLRIESINDFKTLLSHPGGVELNSRQRDHVQAMLPGIIEEVSLDMMSPEVQTALQVLTSSAQPKQMTGISDILHGDITIFDKQTLDIEIIYDFSDPRQVQDWAPHAALSSMQQSRFRISNDSLTLTASDQHELTLLHKARFSELDVIFSGSYDQKGLHAVMYHPTENALISAGGLPGKKDGFIRNWQWSEASLIPALQTDTLPDSPCHISVSWRRGQCNVQLNDRSWPPVALEIPYTQFGFHTKGGSIRINRLTLRGKIDERWYRSQQYPANRSEPYRSNRQQPKRPFRFR